MKEIELLNIPNYYSSFYMKGLATVADIRYRSNTEFQKWNGTSFIIFKYEDKLIVIDNSDPICVRQKLYEEVDFYFTTNKLIGRKDYDQPNVKPLFPHYPVNEWKLYLKVFGENLPRQVGIKEAIKDLYTQRRRPSFKSHKRKSTFNPYIFFAGSIWKKEPWANKQRADFIKVCRSTPGIDFEGGLIPRMDGNNYKMDDVLSPRRYTANEFTTKSSRSLVLFNNPAVCGAISWRVAECLNLGLFILSLPWQIELPINPVHGSEIHMVRETGEIKEFLKFLVGNPTYHHKITAGGKAYFDRHCSPENQIRNILRDIR